MTHREKVLAGAVAGAVAIWVGMQGLGSYRSAVDAADRLQETAERELEDAEFAVERGERAKGRLIEWSKRSLPTDREVAKSLYQDWVRAQLTAAGLQVEALTDRAITRRERHFGELSLEARAAGTLDQLADFLYKFYAAPHLHRIASATLTPSENGAKVTALIGIDALILSDADRKTELASGPEQPLPRPLEEFKTSLTARNVFAPHTPGAGPDAGAAGGARFATAVSDGQGGYHMWVSTDANTRKFKPGDKIEYGKFSGTVLEVDLRHAVIETADGKMEVRAGKTLGEATPVGGTNS
jgi:hypothetical protein